MATSTRQTSTRQMKTGAVTDEFDAPPFVALGSIPLPHLFFGMCPADLAIEPQKIKTSLTCMMSTSLRGILVLRRCTLPSSKAMSKW